MLVRILRKCKRPFRSRRKKPDAVLPDAVLPDAVLPDVVLPVETEEKVFQRPTNDNDKDILIFTVAHIFQGHPPLKLLASTIVRLAAAGKDGDGKNAIKYPFDRCSIFAFDLVRLLQLHPEQGEKAIASFSKSLDEVEQLGLLDESDEVVKVAAHDSAVDIIDDSIAQLKSEYPPLSPGDPSSSKSDISVIVEAGLAAGLTIFGMLKDASEAIPVPILKPVFTCVAILLHSAYQTQLNRQEMRYLASTAADSALKLAGTCAQFSTRLPDGLKTTLTALEETLYRILQECRNLSRKSIAWSFLQNANYKEKLAGWKRELDDAFHKFQTLGIVIMLVGQERLGQKLDSVELNSLPQHPDITDKHNDYLPDSRHDDELAIGEWIDNADELVLWLHATVGMGKSTLARHIGEKLLRADRLAASVLLDVITPDNHQAPGTIVGYIAGELARAHPNAAPDIVNAIPRCSMPYCSLQDKVQSYIREPIRSLRYPQPLVVILDGIDAWKSQSAFFKSLEALNAESRLVKFIVLSRSAPNAATEFPSLSVCCRPLLPISTDVMEQYLQAELGQMDWDDDDKPPSHEIRRLAERANGVFIWARTACKIIKNNPSDDAPRDVLDKILQSEVSVGSLEDLARLYDGAIQLSFPSTTYLDQMQKYLEATFALEQPLPVGDFATLVGFRKRTVRRVGERLFTLPSRKPADAHITVYPAFAVFHSSVIEYFRTIGDNSGTLTAGHRLLAQKCLDALPSFISSLLQSSTLQPLTPLGLYIFRFWPIHITATGFDSLLEGSGRDTLHHMLCSLQNYSMAALRCWAEQLLGSIIRTSAVLKEKYEEDEMGLLMRDVAAALDESWGSHSRMEVEARMSLQVACLEIAVCLDQHNPHHWHDLGKAHLVAAKWHDHASPSSLSKSIFALQQAASIDRGPTARVSDKAVVLSSLAQSIIARAELSHSLEDLESATRMLGEARLLQIRENDIDQYVTLSYIADCLREWYVITRRPHFINGAIGAYREALQALPKDNTQPRVNIMQNLALALNLRVDVGSQVRLLGEETKKTAIADLEESMSLNREALLVPNGKHSHHLHCSVNLANAHQQRFFLAGSIDDLVESVKILRGTLEPIPSGHPSREKPIFYLMLSLQQPQIKDTGISAGDLLEEIIQLAREALSLPPRFRHRVVYLTHLARSYRERYYQLKHIQNDLNETILLHLEILRYLKEDMREERTARIHILCLDFKTRYLVSGNLKDLDGSIEWARKLLALCTEASPPLNMRRAIGLIDSLRLRALRNGSMEDLQESLTLLDSAFRRCPESDALYKELEVHRRYCDRASNIIQEYRSTLKQASVLSRDPPGNSHHKQESGGMLIEYPLPTPLSSPSIPTCTD